MGSRGEFLVARKSLQRGAMKQPHRGGQQMPLFVPETTWETLRELPDLKNISEMAVDTETRDVGLASARGPAWPYKNGHVCGVGIATSEGAFYVPLQHPDSECYDRDAFVRWLTHHFSSKKTRFIFQNAHYDLGWIRADLDVKPPELVDDTMAMAVSLDENRADTGDGYSLDALCGWQGIPGKDETVLREAAAAYCLDPKSEMWKLPARFVGQYAEQDPASTLALARSLRPLLDAQDVTAAYQLEMDIVPCVHEMRWRGVRVDLDRAAQAQAQLRKQRDLVLRQIGDKLKHTVSMDEMRSARWLEKAYDEEGLAYERTKKNDQGQFESKTMRLHAHWLPRLIAAARDADQAENKFLGQYIMAYAHRGRLHANINQYLSQQDDEGSTGAKGTRTSRFSYSDPPLQQMPNRNEDIAAIIRGAFLPEEGETWGALDYSQQEYRLIVHYAEKMDLAKSHEAGDRYRGDPNTDFHDMVAEMTGLERKPAKDTNFAKSYGAGVKKFASMTGMSLERAAATMKQYDTELPFVKELNKECQTQAEKRGYIRMIDGARMHFDLWEPTWRGDDEAYSPPKLRDAAVAHWGVDRRLRRAYAHKAMNGLIQGSAARQTKTAMRDIWRAGLPVPLLQLHDELGFSFSREKDAHECARVMREAIPLLVPMKVDAEFGSTWGNARVIKDKAKKVIYDASWRAARAAAKAEA